MTGAVASTNCSCRPISRRRTSPSRCTAKANAAQNAYLAAKNQLLKLPKDAGNNVGSVRSGVEKLIDDIRQAYESAEATIRRSRGE